MEKRLTSVAFESLCHVTDNLFQIDTQLISTGEVNFGQELAYLATYKHMHCSIQV